MNSRVLRAIDTKASVHPGRDGGVRAREIQALRAEIDALQWARMIEHLHRANHALGRSCRMAMDLAGPKLRTGPLEHGVAVIKIGPERDDSHLGTDETRT